MLEYTLKVGNEIHLIDANNFEEALKKLNEKLKTNYTENQVRVNAVNEKNN